MKSEQQLTLRQIYPLCHTNLEDTVKLILDSEHHTTNVVIRKSEIEKLLSDAILNSPVTIIDSSHGYVELTVKLQEHQTKQETPPTCKQ